MIMVRHCVLLTAAMALLIASSAHGRGGVAIGHAGGTAADRAFAGDTMTPTSWKLTLVASMASLRDSLATFGVRSDATPAFDAQYDAPCPPDPPGDFVETYFPHTGGNWPNLLSTKFMADFSSPSAGWWVAKVFSTVPSGTVTLTWDTAGINQLPPGYAILLKDSATGTVMLMRSRTSYTFSYSGERTFSILFAYDPASISVQARWNLVSLPRMVTDSAKTSLFPSARSSAFAYNGTYVIKTTIEAGKGYWLKFDAAQAVYVPGIGIPSLSIPVTTGWNLVGSVDASVPAPTGGVIGSRFFEYNGTYQVASEIQPGKGYWVKATAPGTILLSSVAQRAATSSPAKAARVDEGLATLRVSDREGHEQHLSVFPAAGAAERAYFDLPPFPPDGGFDARFASGRDREFLDACPTYTILLQSATPVEIALVSNDSRYAVTLRTAKGAAVPPLMTAEQTVTVTLTERPAEFRLGQNYPNPFNPSSTIAYELPEESRVRITLTDPLGREIAAFDEGERGSGANAFILDGGRLSLASGCYYYSLRADGLASGRRFGATKKLLFLK